MSDIHRSRMVVVLIGLYCAAVLVEGCHGRSAATGAQHIRGTVESLNGQMLTVRTANESVQVQLESLTRIGTLVPSDRDRIADGSFVGITSVTDPDGSERAVEIHVFPEAMRGTGEGSYRWDLTGPDASPSRMTNGTASPSRMTNGTATLQGGTSTLTLQYKNGSASGSQTIAIPPGIPIVAIEPGHASDLDPGTHVFVVAHQRSGEILIADRVLVGKDGVVPPM